MRVDIDDKKAAAIVRGIVNDEALSIARNIAIDAKMLAPVDEGDLVMSVRAVKSKFKDGGAIVIAGGGSEYYASFIELGTKKKPAQPFLRPAAERNRSKAKRQVEVALKRKLR